MTKKHKKEFIKAVCNQLKDQLLDKLDDVPENWDGIELRRWIGDVYEDNWKNVGSFESYRKRAYENELLIKNLL